MHPNLATPKFGMSMPRSIGFGAWVLQFFAKAIVWSWAEPLTCGISCSWGHNPLIASVCHLDINTWPVESCWNWRLQLPVAETGWTWCCGQTESHTIRRLCKQSRLLTSMFGSFNWDICEGGKPRAGFQTQCGEFPDNHGQISWLFIYIYICIYALNRFTFEGYNMVQPFNSFWAHSSLRYFSEGLVLHPLHQPRPAHQQCSGGVNGNALRPIELIELRTTKRYALSRGIRWQMEWCWGAWSAWRANCRSSMSRYV